MSNDMKKNIKAYRSFLGLKQKDMAEKIGISVQSYISWENNPEKLNLKKLSLLADIFGCKVEDIFLGDELILNHKKSNN